MFRNSLWPNVLSSNQLHLPHSGATFIMSLPVLAPL